MKARILIVDDEQDMVELLSFNLRRHGYEVVAAHDGLEALKRVRSSCPDLVLLDVMMAGMDGFTFCEFLRREPSTADIPVIMIMALSGQIPRIHGLSVGADAFVTKPFDVHNLMDRVGLLIEAQQQTLRLKEMASDQEDPQSTAR
jgi:DNA-binding response OmpR family regulator